MTNNKKGLVAAIALILVATGLAGCTDDNGDGVDWKAPTQLVLGKFAANEENERIVINITLGDSGGLVTQADGTLRVAIFDSNDVEMLNKTWDIKGKDFAVYKDGGVTNTDYELHIPFADFTKSSDRGGTMRAMVWFTYKDNTWLKEWDFGWFINPDIPDALLLPNETPTADLEGPTTGFTDVSLEFDASGSTDPEDDLGDLRFEWDWGDGETSTIFVDEIESHSYDEPGTYTVTVNVSDSEDAFELATIEVTVDWVLALTVNGIGIVSEAGEHHNDTWVELYIMNQAAETVTVPGLAAHLVSIADTDLENNGTDIVVPTSLGPGDGVTVIIYFDTPEGYEPLSLRVMNRGVEL